MRNIDNLVFNCGNLKFNEKVLIIVDKESANLGNKIFNRLIKKNFDCILHATSPGKIHGEEPNKELENIMLKSDIIFCLRTHSMLHTKARRRSSSNGAKFLSLPDLNKVISNKSMKFNFKKITKKATQQQLYTIPTHIHTHTKFEVKKKESNATQQENKE